jgi:hypothetical protein
VERSSPFSPRSGLTGDNPKVTSGARASGSMGNNRPPRSCGVSVRARQLFPRGPVVPISVRH